MRAPPRCEPLGDVPVRLGDERLVEDPARDARLVGDDDDGEARAVQQPDGVDAVRKEHQPLEPIEIPDFLDERAVAIEKDGRTRHRLRRLSRAPRARADTAREHRVDVDPLHAAVIDRALAQHARDGRTPA